MVVVVSFFVLLGCVCCEWLGVSIFMKVLSIVVFCVFGMILNVL